MEKNKFQFNNYIHCKIPTTKFFVSFLTSNGGTVIRKATFLTGDII